MPNPTQNVKLDFPASFTRAIERVAKAIEESNRLEQKRQDENRPVKFEQSDTAAPVTAVSHGRVYSHTKRWEDYHDPSCHILRSTENDCNCDDMGAHVGQP